MNSETELILRALDDLRDDIVALRGETRQDFSLAFTRLDETRQLVARIDERTRVTSDHEAHDAAPESRAAKAKTIVKKNAAAAGVGAGASALVVTLVEVIPSILRAMGK